MFRIFPSEVWRQLLAAKKYQFVTRSGSGPKFWVFKARSPRMNVGFFNRYKPGVGRANLNVRIGGMESHLNAIWVVVPFDGTTTAIWPICHEDEPQGIG